jgi:PPM family protein phosphatase
MLLTGHSIFEIWNMNINIALFSHVGTEREANQDRILAQHRIYHEGSHAFLNAPHCCCFLADGIGGGPSGGLAATMLLETIDQRIDMDGDLSQPHLTEIFKSINDRMIRYGANHPESRGMGSTLVGLIIRDDKFELIGAGDSQIWISRNGLFFKLTEDQVLDPQEDNSPITSYFGGHGDSLTIRFNDTLREVLADDRFMLVSDGVFKSISPKQAGAVLSNNSSVADKTDFILRKALENGSPDNISCILVEIQKTSIF